MGQTHSFDNAEHVIITPAAGVPMLDWPSDLFGDNASVTDLVTVDFVQQCDPKFMPYSNQSPECNIQLAA